MTSPRLIAIALCFILAEAPVFALTPQGEAAPETPAATEGAAPAEGGAPTAPAAEGVDAPLPPILRSEADLPEPVRTTRAALMAAAKSGNMEELRALMQAQPELPSVSFGDPGDPIEYLMSLSGDADGREILAILLEVLESGFSRVGATTPEEIYVWPYFAQYPLEALDPGQIVELFTLLTAADYEDMKSYGTYTFFRVGIAPDGRWLFFVAGD